MLFDGLVPLSCIGGEPAPTFLRWRSGIQARMQLAVAIVSAASSLTKIDGHDGWAKIKKKCIICTKSN
jgi:hypothetical protein